MARPTTRQQFKDYCLRKLGYPVIEINVDDDQVEDRIDEGLRYYWDYHFDGSEKVYYKHRVREGDRPSRISEITIVNGGSGYNPVVDNIVISAPTSTGAAADAFFEVDGNGTITSINVHIPGNGYYEAPTVTVESATGSGAILTAQTGGYITVPDNIIGAVSVFPIGDPSIRAGDLFNIRYQIALNDLYTLTSVSMVPYVMAMQHISLIQEILVGKQPIRYNRHMNRVYLDMDWNKINNDEYFIIEAYQVVDPEVYTDVWNDRWLQNYVTMLIKKQWGTNLTKFTGMQLPGGVQFNGEKIYNDAADEIDKMEHEMINSFSLPVMDMMN